MVKGNGWVQEGRSALIYAPYVPSDGKVSWLVEPYIKNKIVYDLGAGEGKFLLGIVGKAKEVVAVESDKERAQVCRGKGLKVIEDNFLSIDLSYAEVLFVYQSYLGAHHLANKLEKEEWKGTVVCNSYPLADVLKKPNKADEEVIYKGKRNINLYIYHLRMTTTERTVNNGRTKNS